MILPDDKMPIMVDKDGKKKTVEVVMNPKLLNRGYKRYKIAGTERYIIQISRGNFQRLYDILR